MNAIFRSQFKMLPAVTVIFLASALTATSVRVEAQPVSSSSLYYRMGGGSPTGTAPNRGTLSTQLSAGVRANYSCGKFDIGMSWSTLMNSIQNLGATITGAVQSGIAALPLYFLQSAQPGLYQLF